MNKEHERIAREVAERHILIEANGHDQININAVTVCGMKYPTIGIESAQKLEETHRQGAVPMLLDAMEQVLRLPVSTPVSDERIAEIQGWVDKADAKNNAKSGRGVLLVVGTEPRHENVYDDNLWAEVILSHAVRDQAKQIRFLSALLRDQSADGMAAVHELAHAKGYDEGVRFGFEAGTRLGAKTQRVRDLELFFMCDCMESPVYGVMQTQPLVVIPEEAVPK